MQHLPDIPLVIAGDGPERLRLKCLRRDLNLQNVRLTGKLSGTELDRPIGGSLFTIFPSLAYETLGKSILESYAWGRPVIASDLGSRQELVEPGITGLLYAAGDDRHLADAIEFLFSHAEIAARMGAAGRERVRQKHDPEQHLDTMLRIYSRLIARLSSRTRGSG